MSDIICENCRYWSRADLKSAGGTCHRFPPQLIRQEAQWPVTARLAWCGEWKGKVI